MGRPIFKDENGTGQGNPFFQVGSYEFPYMLIYAFRCSSRLNLLSYSRLTGWYPDVRVCTICSGLFFCLTDPFLQLLRAQDCGEKIKITVICCQSILVGQSVLDLDELYVFVIPQGPKIVTHLGKRPGSIFPDLLSFKDDLFCRYALSLGTLL